MTEMNPGEADSLEAGGKFPGVEEKPSGEPEADSKKVVDPDPGTQAAIPPSRQRTLTRTAELDADGDDMDLLDPDADDAADSITLELALSPHSSTPTPPPTIAEEDFAQLDNSKPFKVRISMSRI